MPSGGAGSSPTGAQGEGGVSKGAIDEVLWAQRSWVYQLKGGQDSDLEVGTEGSLAAQSVVHGPSPWASPEAG